MSKKLRKRSRKRQKNSKTFDKYIKIINLFSDKISQIENEKTIASMIVSDLEELTLKFKNETESLKQILDKLTNSTKISENNKIDIDKNVVKTCNTEKLDDIIKCLKRIHLDMNDRKEFIDNSQIVSFVETNPFDSSETFKDDLKLDFIQTYLNKFCLLRLDLFDSLQLNALYLYYKNVIKKIVFCNLCNDFKKPSNNEYKICERHLVCENCFKNYGKKIKCIKEKLCYCQTNFKF